MRGESTVEYLERIPPGAPLAEWFKALLGKRPRWEKKGRVAGLRAPCEMSRRFYVSLSELRRAVLSALRLLGAMKLKNQIEGTAACLDLQLTVYSQARGAGGMFGEGSLVHEDYLAVLYLDRTFTLKLAHSLGDGLASRGYHVRQVLVRQAQVENRARRPVGLPETFAEVEEQGRQARRDFPVQKALYNLVRLPETLGEGREELHGKLRAALYYLGYGGLLYAGYPDVGNGLREDVLPATLDEAQLAENPTVFEECGRRLLVVAVDLIQPHSTLG